MEKAEGPAGVDLDLVGLEDLDLDSAEVAGLDWAVEAGLDSAVVDLDLVGVEEADLAEGAGLDWAEVAGLGSEVAGCKPRRMTAKLFGLDQVQGHPKMQVMVDLVKGGLVVKVALEMEALVRVDLGSEVDLALVVEKLEEEAEAHSCAQPTCT